MRLSRQYLLGLGSGLILSALLSMVLPSVNVTTSSQENTEQKTGLLSASSGVNSPSSPVIAQANPEDSSKVSPSASQEFTIPSGATAEKIAGLLLEQGWITDKKAFLDAVEKKRAASRFRAGTFTLAKNLSAAEIVDALLNPKGH